MFEKISFVISGTRFAVYRYGKKFYEESVIARQVFEEASEVLGYDLRELCFNGELKELSKTENTQPAILTVSVAAFRIYMEEIGVEPSYLAGHSLGEITALTCAGAIKFSDAVRIVYNRGRFMQEAVSSGEGAMAAVNGVDSDIIAKECTKISSGQEIVVIANYNSSNQTVISGHKSAVSKVSNVLRKKGGVVIPLKVSVPAHSPLMESAAIKLEEELNKYKYSNLQISVISNATALPYKGKEEIIENLKKQMVQPVKWSDSMEYLLKQGVSIAIEMEPKDT